MKIWNFGIIGCGVIAAFHRDAIQELENAKVIAVSSRSDQHVRQFAQASGSDWTTDYHELLRRSDIDIVCVTTSSGSHFQIGMDTLAAGKHLVMEKPIALQASEAQLLIESAESKGLTLSVISQRRFEPHFIILKKLIDENKLGKLMLIEAGTPYFRTQEYYNSSVWRGTIAEDGGAMMNQGIHQLDLLLWLGGEVQTVYGKTATLAHEMEAEDMAVAIVKFTSGLFGTIMSSTSVKPGFPPFIHVYGEKGTVKIHGQSVDHWLVEGVEAPPQNTAVVSDGSSNPSAISHIYHKLQFQGLLESLSRSLPPAVTGLDGKRAVELIQGIIASSLSGKEITLSSL